MPLLKPSTPPGEMTDLQERYHQMKKEYDDIVARMTAPWEQLRRDLRQETLQ